MRSCGIRQRRCTRKLTMAVCRALAGEEQGVPFQGGARQGDTGEGRSRAREGAGECSQAVPAAYQSPCQPMVWREALC